MKRVQELMVELKKTVSTHRGAEVLIGYDEIEKFAELIVRECAGVAKSTEVDDSADYMSGRWWASNDILKHFGVNE